MKTTVVYLHGWGSSPTGQTAQQFKAAFPDCKFVCPLIDHSIDPKKIRTQMDRLAKKLEDHDDVVIVGSSAGGFWADYIGSIYRFKTVLINPSLHPSENFKKYGLPEAYYKAYADLETYVKNHTRPHIVAFAGSEDDVVPFHHVKSRYKNPIVLKGEGHRVKNMRPVFKMVQSLIGNFPEHH